MLMKQNQLGYFVLATSSGPVPTPTIPLEFTDTSVGVAPDVILLFGDTWQMYQIEDFLYCIIQLITFLVLAMDHLYLTTQCN